VRRLKLGSAEKWVAWCKAGERPSNIPSSPYQTYRDDGWISWPDWLGKEGGPDWLPFIMARMVVRKLKLKGYNEWKAWSKSGKRPSNIPSTPNDTYRDDGWISMPDWLGYETTRAPRGQMLPFAVARAIVRKLNMKGDKEWREWRKSGKRPSNIPSSPAKTYRDDGWISLPDWLGYKSLREGCGGAGGAKSESGSSSSSSSSSSRSAGGKKRKEMKKEKKKRKRQLAPALCADPVPSSIPRRSSSSFSSSSTAMALDSAAAAAAAAANAFLTSSSSSSSPRRPALGERVEAQYGTDADEAWFVGRVMAVNADGTCDMHYEDGDKEAGKPWARVRAAVVDAESEETGELELEGEEEEEEEDGELEEGILGRQSTFEMEAIAALAWCGEGSVRVHAAAAIEDGEEEDGDEVAFAFGGKGGGSLSSSSTDAKTKKRKRKKQVSAKERSGEVPVDSSGASAMWSPSSGR
jgi:hypothetical protein